MKTKVKATIVCMMEVYINSNDEIEDVNEVGDILDILDFEITERLY